MEIDFKVQSLKNRLTQAKKEQGEKCGLHEGYDDDFQFLNGSWFVKWDAVKNSRF